MANEGITYGALRFYWGTLIKGLLESKCSNCKGIGCDMCKHTGKMPLKVDVDHVHYEIPLWIFDKKSLHEFLKNISEQFPKKSHNNVPYSMSPSNAEPPEISKILNFFEEIELLATYSGIYLPIWGDRRAANV